MQPILLSKENVSEMLLIEESAHAVPWSQDVFERCFDSKYHAWGVTIGDALIGFVIFSMQVGECHILNLCIHSAYQGNGYGRQLLEYALEVAKQKQAGIAFLEVRRSNSKALALYHKMGFIQVGERKGYYPAAEGREDAILFALDLSV